MFGLGTPELIVILGIAFLVFGGKKLPEIGAGLGKGIRAFKRGISDVEEGGKNLVNDTVPGVKEAVAIKENIDQIKSVGKLVK